MRDMLRAFSLFPWFVFLSLLIPWQTLMRLQLPGSANTRSIIHPVQLHPLNSPHTVRHTSHAPTCMLCISLKHTYIHPLHSTLSHGLTPRCHCYKSLALFIYGRLQIWAKTVQKGGNSWGISLKAAVSFKNSLKGRWQVLFRLEYKVPLCTLRLSM